MVLNTKTVLNKILKCISNNKTFSYSKWTSNETNPFGGPKNAVPKIWVEKLDKNLQCKDAFLAPTKKMSSDRYHLESNNIY